MPRKPKSDANGTDEGAKRESVGGNVSKATLLHHYSVITGLQAEMAGIRQEMKTAWDEAEAAGLDKKVAKRVFKLASEDPATIDLYVRSFTHYTQQMGLFDRIDEWKQAEATEANGASVDAAERELHDA